MVMTGKRHLSPDIWPETPNQGIGNEEIIFTTWYKKAMKRNKINPQQYYLSMPNAKKAYYASYISSDWKNIYTHLITDI